MKTLIAVLSFPLALVLLTSCKKTNESNTPPTNTDSFTVTVTNGYGSAKYKTGDTVHIFSSNYTTNQLFDKWSGDVSILNAPDEWHTWFIMPAKNVSFTGSIKNIAPFTLNYEQIKGRDRMKPVYYYFPAGHKGFVYLLHGTGGSASALVGGYEFQQLIKDLVSNGFGVIVTEAEESTTQTDANDDGKIRWALLPFDSVTNVDYANIRIVTDTFYNRGLTDRSKLRYSIGMSDGGFYSAALSNMYHYKAAVAYCAQASSNLMQTTTIPFQFCMARFDNNPSVGPDGNAAALSYSNAMNARNVCSKYLIKERAPLYPERFARRGDISISQSQSIFTELKAKGYIDSKNYYIGYSDGFINDYKNNPSSFQSLKGFTVAQLAFVMEQINISVSDHHMYSDYNRATLKFLNVQCQ